MVYEQLSLSGFRVEKGYYTTREVSELYSVSQHTVIDWINKGWMDASRLDGNKKPGHWRVHPQSIEDIDRATQEILRAIGGCWCVCMALAWRTVRHEGERYSFS